MKKKKRQHTMVVNYKDVPRALHSHFKAACALRGISQRDKYLDLIREWTQKLAERKT
jgi:hypothetical protein